MKRSDLGLTLLELAAVLAILSVVSLMALQLLSAGLMNRNQTNAARIATADLVAVTALMRRDLTEMVPTGAGQALVVTGDRMELSLTSGRGVQNVTWLTKNGALLRIIRAAGGEPQSVTLLEDIANLRVLVMTSDDSWSDAANWNAEGFWEMPRAIEVRFDTAEVPDIRVLVAR